MRHTRPSSEAKWVHLSLPFSQLDLTLPKEQLKMAPTPCLRLSWTLRHRRSVKHTVPPAIHRKCWDTVDDQLEVSTTRYSCICELAEEVDLGHRLMQLPTPSVDLDPAGNGACFNDSGIHSRQAGATMQIKTAARSNMVQRVVVQTSQSAPTALPLSKSHKSLLSSLCTRWSFSYASSIFIFVFGYTVFAI